MAEMWQLIDGAFLVQREATFYLLCSFKHLNPLTPPCLPFTGQLPARLSQAQTGSSSDLSTTLLNPHTTCGKELPHLGQRKEDEALPGSLCLEHDSLLFLACLS